MSHQITLPSGASATIKDPADIGFGDREDVLEQFDGINLDGKLTGSAGHVMVQFQRALIAFGVESWTCTDRQTGEALPLPSADPAVVRRLTSLDGSALFAAVQPLTGDLFPNFDPSPETESPTSPSVA